ncbi:hypothetical protein, partial [Roseibium sp. MMSF_3544]|uniref:hypothetical protein n=1 Tax=Roseibium sp. MMSF_3544 TaxID=3046723 RepID=UPI00273E304C
THFQSASCDNNSNLKSSELKQDDLRVGPGSALRLAGVTQSQSGQNPPASNQKKREDFSPRFSCSGPTL